MRGSSRSTGTGSEAFITLEKACCVEAAFLSERCSLLSLPSLQGELVVPCAGWPLAVSSEQRAFCGEGWAVRGCSYE